MESRFRRGTRGAAGWFPVAMLIGVLAAGLPAARHVLAAQSSKSVVDGVYTDAQAARGQALYTKSCTICHGDPPVGTAMAPGLAGDDFLTAYNGMTAGDVYTKIIKTMPGDDPGSLKPQETVDLIAYLFKANKWPAGSVDLPEDLPALKQIRIQSKLSR